MQVHLRGLTCGATSLTVYPSDTVWDLKLRLQAQRGLPPSQVVFVWARRQLENHEALGEAGMEHNATIHYIMKLASVAFCGIPWCNTEASFRLTWEVDGCIDGPSHVSLFTTPQCVLRSSQSGAPTHNNLSFWHGDRRLVNEYSTFAESGVALGSVVVVTDGAVPTAFEPRSLLDLCTGTILREGVAEVVSAFYEHKGLLPSDVKQRLLASVSLDSAEVDVLLDPSTESIHAPAPLSRSSLNRILDNCANVVKLHLDDTPLEPPDLDRVAKACPHLQNLSIASCATPEGDEIDAWRTAWDSFFDHSKHVRGIGLAFTARLLHAFLPALIQARVPLVQLNIMQCLWAGDLKYVLPDFENTKMWSFLSSLISLNVSSSDVPLAFLDTVILRVKARLSLLSCHSTPKDVGKGLVRWNDVLRESVQHFSSPVSSDTIIDESHVWPRLTHLFGPVDVTCAHLGVCAPALRVLYTGSSTLDGIDACTALTHLNAMSWLGCPQRRLSADVSVLARCASLASVQVGVQEGATEAVTRFLQQQGDHIMAWVNGKPVKSYPGRNPKHQG